MRLAWYVIAYLPVGIPVIKDAVRSVLKGAFFSEFFLMTIATLGAFAIGEYPEGVAVMLFYTVGELFQGLAVTRAKANIKSLLDSKISSFLLRIVQRCVGEVIVRVFILIKFFYKVCILYIRQKVIFYRMIL